MKTDHVLPSGGQWDSGAANIRLNTRTVTSAVPGREIADPTVSDTVDISESGQNLNELEKTIESLREYAGWGNFNINFAKDDQSGSLVISIIDRDSGEVLRQIPADEILSLRSHLRELLSEVFDKRT